jgi:hypothetical protein
VCPPQITAPEALLAGALAEALVRSGAVEDAGAPEAGPLAVVEVDGGPALDDVEADGEGEGLGDVDGDEDDVLGFGDEGGGDVGGLDGDFDGELDEPPPPDPFVPLGLSDGVPPVSDGGVGSSEVP